MPIKVKIESKLSEGLYKASGKFVGVDKMSNPLEAPLTVLLKETGKKELTLFLDSKVMESKLDGKVIINYINAQPIPVQKIEVGAEVSLSKIWFTLKK